MVYWLAPSPTVHSIASAWFLVCLPYLLYLRHALSIAALITSLEKLVPGETGQLADHSDTEMALKKGKKKAAGPAKIPRTDTRSAEMDAKLKRIGELKAKFAGVAKAVRPALVEMAGRTSKQLSHSTYHKDGRRKAPYDALVGELEKVRDSNIARRVAYHKTYQELKAVSVQHETFQEMTKIENQYRVIDVP